MSIRMGGVSYGVGPATINGSSPSAMLSDSPNSSLSLGSPENLRSASKTCGVCGDVAKSMHFGGLSCDSCKAFFRRSVQNNAYKGFTCPYDRNCVIGISSRKACQHCRFEKCISIGMEKGWVMSEEERRRMMDQRKEKKVRQMQELGERDDQSLYKLSEEDRSEISRILSLYKKAYNTIPYDESEGGATPQMGGGAGSSGVGGGQLPPGQDQSLLVTWMTFCKRLAYFFSLFRDFAELSAGDQSLLLKTALTSAGIIMGSVVYDSNSGRWAAKLSKPVSSLSDSSVSSHNVEKLVPTELINRVDKFFRKFQQICPDETMAMILILVSLYSPELMGLEARERVQNLQERYIYILQKYVRYKFKEKSSVMFPKAIVSLADIRELADRTGQMRIQNRPTSMFSSLLQNSSGSSCLGSPYTDLSLNNSNLNSTLPSWGGGEIVRSDSSGPDNDPIYQRIMKVIYQMHASSLNARTPTLLPLIIQILKKWAHNRQTAKANSGKALMGPTRRAHRLSKPRIHRANNHRSKRLGGVKKESMLTEIFPVTIKEEVMDQVDDISFCPDSNHLPDLQQQQHQTTKQPLLETYHHQQQQQHPQFHLNPQSTGICTPQSTSPTVPHNQHLLGGSYSPEPLHHYSPEHQFLPHSQPYPSSNPSPLSYSSGSSPLPYPQAITPEENNYSFVNSQNSMHQSHLSSSPYPHNQNMTSSPTLNSFGGNNSPLCNNDSSSYASSIGNSMSPYSSSSSSSSPEDSNTATDKLGGAAELSNEDFTDTEFDVIMQLMERVSNFELLERSGAGSSSPSHGGSNVTDILPLPLLKELQAKLCSFNSTGDAYIDSGSPAATYDGGASSTYSPSPLSMQSDSPISLIPPAVVPSSPSSISTMAMNSSSTSPPVQGTPAMHGPQQSMNLHVIPECMEVDPNTLSQNSLV